MGNTNSPERRKARLKWKKKKKKKKQRNNANDIELGIRIKSIVFSKVTPAISTIVGMIPSSQIPITRKLLVETNSRGGKFKSKDQVLGSAYGKHTQRTRAPNVGIDHYKSA